MYIYIYIYSVQMYSKRSTTMYCYLEIDIRYYTYIHVVVSFLVDNVSACGNLWECETEHCFLAIPFFGKRRKHRGS